MEECYEANYQPLDLTAYVEDRNYRFYELQNELLKNVNNSEKYDSILWEMFPFIEGVVRSLAKKKICKGVSKTIPDFDGKCFEAALETMGYYKDFPYYRAKKLENVAFHKVRQVFLNKNTALFEQSKSVDYLHDIGIEISTDDFLIYGDTEE